jgi:hypothetical protein
VADALRDERCREPVKRWAQKARYKEGHRFATKGSTKRPLNDWQEVLRKRAAKAGFEAGNPPA